MSTQFIASQEKVVANGKHCVDTEKSLSTQGNWCVNTTLFDWCTHRFFVCWYRVFLCKAVSRVLFQVRKLLFE